MPAVTANRILHGCGARELQTIGAAENTHDERCRTIASSLNAGLAMKKTKPPQAEAWGGGSLLAAADLF
jgi:hypothetical protein